MNYNQFIIQICVMIKSAASSPGKLLIKNAVKEYITSGIIKKNKKE